MPDFLAIPDGTLAFEFKHVAVDVINTVLGLKNSYSTDVHGMTPNILKHIVYVIAPVSAHFKYHFNNYNL